MTPEEKKAIQVALSLRYGVKEPTCDSCSFGTVRDIGDLLRDGCQIMCDRTKEVVHSDDVCPKYSLSWWRGIRAGVTMLDEISPVPDNHKHSWRNIPS